jgi:hypothetical protein
MPQTKDPADRWLATAKRYTPVGWTACVGFFMSMSTLTGGSKNHISISHYPKGTPQEKRDYWKANRAKVTAKAQLIAANMRKRIPAASRVVADGTTVYILF